MTLATRAPVVGPAPERWLRRWNDEEDRQLRSLLEEGLPIRRIAKRLARTEDAVWERAHRVGMRLGCPEGFEYLCSAAERTGYSPRTLRNILRWAGKKPRRAQSQPRGSSRGARYHRNVVDSVDVDDAVEAWFTTEIVGAAERRYGVSHGVIARALRRAGIVPPEGLRRMQHWRVPSADIERVMTAKERAA